MLDVVRIRWLALSPGGSIGQMSFDVMFSVYRA